MAKDQLLLITFKAPLDRFRRVNVELLEGVTTVDGVAFKPWSLTFTTGDR